MTEKQLKKLKRSELLEIILMLKENEKVLEEENKELKEQISKLLRKTALRQSALMQDDALGNAVKQMDDAYVAFKKSAITYHFLLEEIGADAVESKLQRKKGSASNEE